MEQENQSTSDSMRISLSCVPGILNKMCFPGGQHLKLKAVFFERFYSNHTTSSLHCYIVSVKFSYSVVSDSLSPHRLQRTRLPYHQLPELAQTHVHQASDAIQPSHPLSSPSPPAFNHSQHQGLSQWVSSSHQVAKVLEFQLQHQSIQWLFRTEFL